MPRGVRREEPIARRIYTPIQPFSTTERGLPITLAPGVLVDDGDPIYRRFKDLFREPRVRHYER